MSSLAKTSKPRGASVAKPKTDNRHQAVEQVKNIVRYRSMPFPQRTEKMSLPPPKKGDKIVCGDMFADNGITFCPHWLSTIADADPDCFICEDEECMNANAHPLDMVKTETCPNASAGWCYNGKRCQYAHVVKFHPADVRRFVTQNPPIMSNDEAGVALDNFVETMKGMYACFERDTAIRLPALEIALKHINSDDRKLERVQVKHAVTLTYPEVKNKASTSESAELTELKRQLALVQAQLAKVVQPDAFSTVVQQPKQTGQKQNGHSADAKATISPQAEKTAPPKKVKKSKQSIPELAKDPIDEDKLSVRSAERFRAMKAVIAERKVDKKEKARLITNAAEWAVDTEKNPIDDPNSWGAQVSVNEEHEQSDQGRELLVSELAMALIDNPSGQGQ